MKQLSDSLTIQRLMLWILFLLLFVMAVRVPVDTDTWWHLRSGEIMLDDGELLREDRFSLTRDGEDWVNHSWGGQILYTLAYHLTGGDGAIDDGGVIGLAVLTAILATGGMALVYRMSAGSVYSKAFVLVIGAAAAAIFWSPRPQMFTFFLSAAVMYILYLYKWQRRDVLWLIPILMIFWVNLHAGFAVGFIYLLLFIIGEAAANLLPTDDENVVSWRRLGKVALITGISIAALAINPYGLRMIGYAFETAGLQTLNAFIQEWQSPNFKNPQTWPFILLLLAVIGFAGATQKRIAWSDLALVGGTAALALWAGRNIAVFAVAAVPVLSRQVDTFLAERGWQIRPTRRTSIGRALLNLMLLSLIALIGLVKIGADLTPRNVEKIQADLLPVDAIEFLRENPPEGNLLNSYNWGGLLIFELPETPVFVDGRTDLYGDDFLRQYFRTYLGASDWRELLEKHEIQTVFLEKEAALATLLREEGWQVVYEDEQAVILERE